MITDSGALSSFVDNHWISGLRDSKRVYNWLGEPKHTVTVGEWSIMTPVSGAMQEKITNHTGWLIPIAYPLKSLPSPDPTSSSLLFTTKAEVDKSATRWGTVTDSSVSILLFR